MTFIFMFFLLMFHSSLFFYQVKIRLIFWRWWWWWWGTWVLYIFDVRGGRGSMILDGTRQRKRTEVGWGRKHNFEGQVQNVWSLSTMKLRYSILQETHSWRCLWNHVFAQTLALKLKWMLWAVRWRGSVKKMLPKISQNLQENTWVAFPFLIKSFPRV